MIELVERLRQRADAAMSTVPIDRACGNVSRAQHNEEQAELDRQAADRIEALEARERELVELLRHVQQPYGFADVALANVAASCRDDFYALNARITEALEGK